MPSDISIIKAVCARLKQARGTKSQQAVATDAGISVRTISRLESADTSTHAPRRIVLIRLALATDNQPEEWLKLAGYNPEPELVEKIRLELTGRKSIFHVPGKDEDILPILKSIVADEKLKSVTFAQLQRLIRLKLRVQELENEIEQTTRPQG
jgi:transcriptional regulator with XRE-family HTH domain